MFKIETLEKDQEFRDRMLHPLKLSIRVATLLATFGFTVFAIVDPFFGDVNLQALYIVRIVLVLFELSVLTATFTRWAHQYSFLRFLSYLPILFSGWAIAHLTMLVGGPKSAYWTMIILTFFGGSLLMQYTLLQSAVLYFFILVIYNLYLLAYGYEFFSIFSLVSDVGLFLSWIVAFVASGYLRHLKVIDFKRSKTLHNTNLELQKILKELSEEKEKSERLLLNILPDPIARKLKYQNQIIAERHEEVSILFADIVNFTTYADSKPPEEVVKILNRLFSLFDDLTEKYGLEKIKTIGDAYLAVCGLPESKPDHLEKTIQMAIEMFEVTDKFNKDTQERFQLRIGIHSGPVVAGIIGKKKFIYDLWGDSVNIASRMESTGVPGKIQITDELLKKLPNRYYVSERGVIEVKGKGYMRTYFVSGKLK